MNKKRVVIIGAGIAGLSAGCYLQMNGYDTQIFEMGSNPGGLCTSWKMNGYTFDGCIHWLVGSGPSDSYHKFWRELGALKDKEIVDFDEFMRIESTTGKTFIVYTDADKLSSEMKRFAPHDANLIDELIGAVKNFAAFNLPTNKAYELYNVFDGIKILFTIFPFFKLIKKWNIPIEDYAKRFLSPILREAIPLLWGIPNSSMVFLIMTLAWMHKKSAGYPIGGSLEFSKSIERRYLDLGGRVSYNSKVVKIITQDGKAAGIKLENGETHEADIVISAADGHYTIFEMLEGKYVNKEILDIYENMEIFPAIIQVSLGVAHSFKDVPHSINFPLDELIKIDNRNAVRRMGIRIFNFDPTMAPEDKTSIVTFFPADYEYWMKLKGESPQNYLQEKERIVKATIAALEKRFKGIASKVEIYDVATPATYFRYTNNWRGSFEGWLPTTKTLLMRIKKTLPGLGNFYMIGQWVQPGGGVPTGAMTGRDITQIICKMDNKKFHTTIG